MTPFVLKRVNEISCGQSLTANIALIENNAKIGSEIAFQYTQLINALPQPLQCLHDRAFTLSNNSYSPPKSSKPEVESTEESQHKPTQPNNNQSELSPVRQYPMT